jgi:hypothetical protein
MKMIEIWAAMAVGVSFYAWLRWLYEMSNGQRLLSVFNFFILFFFMAVFITMAFALAEQYSNTHN